MHFEGAEATITTKDGKIHKIRHPKTYRISQVDESLRFKRTKSEASILAKLKSKGIRVPHVESVTKDTIVMELIDGPKLRDALNTSNAEQLGQLLGTILKNMHDMDIIHGDLTTSNILLEDNALVLIDFGLAYHSTRIEDKAVDLHLLKKSLEAYHHDLAQLCFVAVMNAYNDQTIEHRLQEVEKRGRNKKH